MLSCVRLFSSPRTTQPTRAPRSVKFSKHEYWRVLLLLKRIFWPRIEPKSLLAHLQADYTTTTLQGSPVIVDLWLKKQTSRHLIIAESLNWCSLCLSFQHLFLPALYLYSAFSVCPCFMGHAGVSWLGASVVSSCFCVRFSHLSSFGDSFLFRLQLKQPTQRHLLSLQF